MRKQNYSNADFRGFEQEREPLLLPESSSSSSRNRNWFKYLNRRFQLNNLDWMIIAALGVGAMYFMVREPLMSAILLSSSLFFYCLSFIFKYIPIFNRLIGTRIRFWHVAATIIALAAVFSAFNQPAHAIFLSGLEKAIKNLATSTTAQGVQNGNLAQGITYVFAAIRVVFLLLVAAAALFAYNQAQQGNDWRPIATQAALAIGIVLVIDVITYLFVGDTQIGAANASLPLSYSVGMLLPRLHSIGL